MHRLLENGNVTEAGAEKQRLEQLQRDRIKQEEASGKKSDPRWFQYVCHLNDTRDYCLRSCSC